MNAPPETKGYVPIPRCVLSSPILHSNEERMFFIELCALAEWGPTEKELSDGHKVILMRGEVHISERTLSKDSGLHRNTIRRIFERAERAGWISFRNAPGLRSNGTIASIKIYDGYQEVKPVEVRVLGKLGTIAGTAVGTNIYMDEEGKTKKEEPPYSPPDASERASGGVGQADDNVIGSDDQADEPDLFGPDGDIADPVLREEIRQAEQPCASKRRKSCLDTAAAKKDPSLPLFKKFYYESMPKRPDGSDLKRSWNAFRAVVASGVPAERIVEGAEAYKACMIRKGACAEDGSATSDFIKAAQNWLSNEEPQWEKYIAIWANLKNQPVNNVHRLPTRNNRYPQHETRKPLAGLKG